MEVSLEDMSEHNVAQWIAERHFPSAAEAGLKGLCGTDVKEMLGDWEETSSDLGMTKIQRRSLRRQLDILQQDGYLAPLPTDPFTPLRPTGGGRHAPDGPADTSLPVQANPRTPDPALAQKVDECIAEYNERHGCNLQTHIERTGDKTHRVMCLACTAHAGVIIRGSANLGSHLERHVYSPGHAQSMRSKFSITIPSKKPNSATEITPANVRNLLEADAWQGWVIRESDADGLSVECPVCANTLTCTGGKMSIPRVEANMKQHRDSKICEGAHGRKSSARKRSPAGATSAGKGEAQDCVPKHKKQRDLRKVFSHVTDDAHQEAVETQLLNLKEGSEGVSRSATSSPTLLASITSTSSTSSTATPSSTATASPPAPVTAQATAPPSHLN
jgi:hypothetical protein